MKFLILILQLFHAHTIVRKTADWKAEGKTNKKFTRIKAFSANYSSIIKTKNAHRGMHLKTL